MFFKQSIFKKATAVMLATVMTAVPVAASAAQPRELPLPPTPINIVTIGDSIGRGYSVEPKDPCFSQILATWTEDQLIASNGDVSYVNYATDGYTTPDVINQIAGSDEIQDAISKSTVINVSLGGNELIQFLLQQVCIAIGIEYNRDTVYEDIMNNLSDLEMGLGALSDPRVKAIMDRISSGAIYEDLTVMVQEFRKNSNTLIQTLSSLNPSAEIIYTTIPRPSHAMLVGPLLDTVIDRRYANYDSEEAKEEALMQDTPNKAILEKFGITDEKINLQVVDSFTYFYDNCTDESPLTNVIVDFSNLGASVFDPHPNAKGQAAIAELFKPLYAPIIEKALHPFLPGDVSGDNKLDTRDALMILKHVAQMQLLSEKAVIVGDINNDGVTNTIDALIILKRVAQIPES